MRSLLIYLLALCALGAGAYLGLPGLFGDPAVASTSAEQPRGTSAPPPVVVAPAVRRPFEDELQALGTVHANESVTITPNRADHVAAIHFVDGQQVEAGALLLEMHAAEERALLGEAVALRDDRREHLQQVEALFEQQLNSRRERDNARALLAAAEARVISLQAAIADREVRAPFAGTLGLREVSEGAYLQPAARITTLDDLSVVKLDFTIPETWLASVAAGMAITATSDAYRGEVFRGEIRVVDTRLDARTRSVIVRARLPNVERLLRPGMLLKVRVSRSREPVLQVPEESLIPVGQRQFVLRLDDGDVAERTEVTIGRRRVGAVEVVEGLAEGDRVVVEGILRVRPGSPVQVVASRSDKP